MLTCKETAALLQSWDDILVICHASPDGDALGSMSGLVRGLRALGKRAGWYCADPAPQKFMYMFEGLEDGPFPPAHVVTLDVADRKLLGDAEKKYGGRIGLAIDHHGTHKPFADKRWVDPQSPATAGMVWSLLKELGVSIDNAMADCLYTGMATDTGCFRYRNATPQILRLAAEAIEAGARSGDINQKIFETKTRAVLEAERRLIESMEFFCGGKGAVMQIPLSLYEATGAAENELSELVGLPKQVEGVLVGITLKERAGGIVKASLRTNPPVNAAVICEKFGGGGHPGGAGCSFEGLSMEIVRAKMLAACEEYLAEIGCI